MTDFSHDQECPVEVERSHQDAEKCLTETDNDALQIANARSNAKELRSRSKSVRTDDRTIDDSTAEERQNEHDAQEMVQTRPITAERL